MKTFLYDEEQRRMWVRHKHNKTKSVQQICREAAISRATLYNWISEFPEEATRAREHREPEDKSRLQVVQKLNEQPTEPDGAARYRMLLSALNAVDGDKAFARKLVPVLVKRFTLTVAQACALVGMEEAAYGYKPRKPEANDQEVYDELVRLITEEPSRGFTECYQLLQRSHPAWPRKQIRRIYKEKRVFLLRKRTRKVPAKNTDGDVATPVQEIAVVRRQRPGTTWSLGLVEGRTSAGGAFWLSYIIDAEDNTVLNAAAGQGHATREDLLDFLSLAAMENGQPKKLRIPGREPFTGRELTRWAWDQRAALITLTPNKPENQEELNAMDERVRQAIIAGGAENLPGLQDWIESWIGD